MQVGGVCGSGVNGKIAKAGKRGSTSNQHRRASNWAA